MWPKAYLVQYYRQVRGENDFLLDAIAAGYVLWGRHGGKLLEVGGGPTIYQLVPACGWVDRIVFTDLLPENLAAVEAWRADEAGAHDWSSFFRHVHGPDADSKAAWLRSALAVQPPADAREIAAGRVFPPASFAAISSFFCLETLAADAADLAGLLGGLGALLGEGGAMILGVMRNCRSYRIGSAWVNSIPLNETDIEAVLARAGMGVRFLRTLPCPGEDGYDGLMVVLAERMRIRPTPPDGRSPPGCC
ncbi:MAG: NNMT/PNMT/TEMT family class I SAM-dependent methyltransferase [Magnetospirillum sp. WYHS-4]